MPYTLPTARFQLFRPGYRLKSDFNTVQDLKVGDRVKMGGVEVGRVENIGLTNNKVRVTMKLSEAPGPPAAATPTPTRFFTVAKIQRALGETSDETGLQALLDLHSFAPADIPSVVNEYVSVGICTALWIYWAATTRDW